MHSHTLYIHVSPEPPYSVSIGGISKLITPASLRLTCYASGAVERYEWYHSGSRLPSTVSDYRKSSAQLSDSGSYQCKACNFAGCSTRSSYTVTVIGWFSQIEYMTVQFTIFLYTSVCYVYMVCYETSCIIMHNIMEV